MHKSVRMETPCEFINITPLNPLISKCQIKVCYVSDEPNRNRSVITKETARKLANSLPGNPIVGFFNDKEGDFEEHNRTIEISNGVWKLKDTTKPYGFVDLNAKVWFAKYYDDDQIEREYLCTEGYLWTGQYPECQRIMEGNGNNHSMELDEKTLDATWTKDGNGKPKFFIINEGIISKLCILGEEFEPCFEGSSISKPEYTFSFEPSFIEEMHSMMSELKELLQEGGTKVADYKIEAEELEIVEPASDDTVETEFKKQDEEEEKKGKDEKSDDPKSDNKSEGEKKEDSSEEEPKDGEKKEPPASSDDKKDEDEKKDDKEEDEDEKKKKKFSLEDYEALETKCAELETKFSDLETKYNAVVSEKSDLEAQLTSLTEFKCQVERKDKEAMIANFYMLSDEDKKDVVDNIDKYSLDDIEAKLSIICVRNKVSFNLDEDTDTNTNTTFNLGGDPGTEAVPAWVKAVLDTAKTM